MEDCQLKWRFTEKKYDLLQKKDLELLKPLDKLASTFLADYISNSTLHQNLPFKKGFFKTLEKAKVIEGNEQEIKKWLYQLKLPFDKEIYLSWDNQNAMIVPCNLLIKYFESFYYSSSDDLTVFDKKLNWAILFFHEDEIYFGTNE
ncbi:MAG TPA: hypothetical protein VNG53_02210 [Bacteroidia bacterium]|nr:hypothetical protein [Bacteroidia bacterium]